MDSLILCSASVGGNWWIPFILASRGFGNIDVWVCSGPVFGRGHCPLSFFPCHADRLWSMDGKERIWNLLCRQHEVDCWNLAPLRGGGCPMPASSFIENNAPLWLRPAYRAAFASVDEERHSSPPVFWIVLAVGSFPMSLWASTGSYLDGIGYYRSQHHWPAVIFKGLPRTAAVNPSAIGDISIVHGIITHL